MTSREKNLLIIVASLVLIGLFWFLAYRPLMGNITEINGEITTLNGQLSALKLEYGKKDEFLGEIDRMGEFIDDVNARFPVVVDQETIIKTLIDLENEIESLEIPTYSMSPSSVVITAGEYQDAETGELRYKEVLFKSQVTLDLVMSYADMKKMLAYIRNSEHKLSVNGMNMTSDLVNDVVQTSFALDFYYLAADDRVYQKEDYFGPFEPKEESIFAPFEEYGTSFDAGVVEDEVVAEEDDFIINLSTIYADRSTVILYKNRDLTGDTYVYDDANAMIPVEIVFDQNGEEYVYKYKTSSEQFPGSYDQGVAFEPGSFIDMAVYSSARVDADDNSGVDITIINNTDLPLNIRIQSDDEAKPRFNIVNQTGDVQIVN